MKLSTKNIPFKLIVFTGICSMSVILFSCYRCSCHCEYSAGCTTVLATNQSGDTVVAKKTFCAIDNFINDKGVADSISNFYNHYTAANRKINSKDSTWNHDSKTHLTCKEADRLKNYACTCAK